MARVKQQKMRLDLDPSHPYKETVVCINYDSTDRRTQNYRRPIPEERFYIKLPQVVADALGILEVRAVDQVVVMERFKEAIEKFKSLKTEVNRVILYDFEVEPRPKDGRGFYHAIWDGQYKVRIWAGTYQETVAIAGDGAKRYSYERIESEVNFSPPKAGTYRSIDRQGGKRYDCQVPWTKQNGAFFIWIKERMKELVDRLNELEQPGKLIETINAGRLLPLGNPEVKKTALQSTLK